MRARLPLLLTSALMMTGLAGCDPQNPDPGAGGAGGDPVSCGGRAGPTCGDDAFCDFAMDGCDFADAQGVCMPRPDGCDDVFDPVCGCDGQTYSNLCEAQVAGVDAAASGACEGPDICALPAEPGPCEAAFDRWYFDAEAGACQQFLYGGCDGNANNFETREACEAACDAGPPPVACPDQSRDWIVLGGGVSFGECLEGCVSRLTIRRDVDDAVACDVVTLEVCDHGFDGACTMHTGALTAEGHRQARAIADALDGVALDEVYGCPDCADGGASTIDLQRGRLGTSHVYETGNPPEVLGEADAFVSGMIRALRRCEGNAMVAPDAGCAPR